MTGEIFFVFGLLTAVTLLFIWDKFRMDMVALFSAIALALSGVISPAEAVAGFGAPVVVMIAALFVVGEGLFRTGIASKAGQWLLRAGQGSETRLLILLIPMIALISAFMSSTGAVALFIPIILTMCHKSSLAPSKLLMPVAFASLIGGMLTLIGTPPNIVVSSALENAGLEPFHFFDFTPIGLAVLAMGICYQLTIGRRLLPERGTRDQSQRAPYLQEFAERYHLSQHLHSMITPVSSSLVGKTVSEAALRTRFEVTVVAIERHGHLTSSLLPVLAQTRIEPGDRIIAYGEEAGIGRMCQALDIRRKGFPARQIQNLHKEFGLAEVMLRRTSSMLGKTIKAGRFREQFGLSVIGLRRNNQFTPIDFDDTELQFADSLLVVGGWNHIEKLPQYRDFVIVDTPAEMQDASAHADKAPHAIVILLLMLVAMASGFIPALNAILAAAFAMIAFGCVTMEEAYKSLSASSLVLIACMLPMALAMEKSGAAGLIVEQLTQSLQHSDPLVLGACLFIFTSVFSQFISNTATTVLVAPIALSTSLSLGYQAEPFLMMVAIAASTAFATPVASPVNTLICAPGNYKFTDFAKVGIPLQLITLLLALWLTPILFPFS